MSYRKIWAHKGSLSYLSKPIEHGLETLGVRLELGDVHGQDEEVFLLPPVVAASLCNLIQHFNQYQKMRNGH